MQSIKNIGVIGAGTMGSGIAQVFALKNFSVILVDREENLLKRGIEKIKKNTPPDQINKLINNINCSIKIENTNECDLVVEAIYEDERVKKDILKSLSMICNIKTVIATNTSSISINSLAEAIDNPSRFIGMHFMNPPLVMKLIEVVKGKDTSDTTVKTVTDLAKSLDKIPAVVNDSPGFVSNRLLFALIGEAISLLENGIATKEDIDSVMKYGMNHPMGPIKLADFIGLDVCMDILIYLDKNLSGEKYRPPKLLRTLVKEGKLGKKAGKGFYDYYPG